MSGGGVVDAYEIGIDLAFPAGEGEGVDAVRAAMAAVEAAAATAMVVGDTTRVERRAVAAPPVTLQRGAVQAPSSSAAMAPETVESAGKPVHTIGGMAHQPSMGEGLGSDRREFGPACEPIEDSTGGGSSRRPVTGYRCPCQSRPFGGQAGTRASEG